MGAVMGLGSGEEVEQRKAWDVVRIDLRNREQLKDARFQDFLRQHYSAFREYCQP
jgi:hypothetical protein